MKFKFNGRFHSKKKKKCQQSTSVFFYHIMALVKAINFQRNFVYSFTPIWTCAAFLIHPVCYVIRFFVSFRHSFSTHTHAHLSFGMGTWMHGMESFLLSFFQFFALLFSHFIRIFKTYVQRLGNKWLWGIPHVDCCSKHFENARVHILIWKNLQIHLCVGKLYHIV